MSNSLPVTNIVLFVQLKLRYWRLFDLKFAFSTAVESLFTIVQSLYNIVYLSLHFRRDTSTKEVTALSCPYYFLIPFPMRAEGSDQNIMLNLNIVNEGIIHVSRTYLHTYLLTDLPIVTNWCFMILMSKRNYLVGIT